MSQSLLYLSRADVAEAGVTMTEIIEAVDHMFREKGEGRVEMPPKPGIHPSATGFIHAMPAYVPAAAAAGLKWVSAYPENKDAGLPYVSGLMVMNDPGTGLPTAVLDCTWITAMRTAAATAVAARYLARPESSSLAIVACGVQGRTNLQALATQFDLRDVRAYDHRVSNSERYATEMCQATGLEIRVVESAEEAVRDADLVVTSGPIAKPPKPTIQPGWLAPGAFACPLDFDSYWTGEAMAEIDRFVTDDRTQLEYYRSIGYFAETPSPHADLGEIACGAAAGRTAAAQRTMSMNLGLALEDVVTAVRVVERARERGLGTELPL